MTTLEEIRKKARAKMNGCYVCPDCDGNACSGMIPGYGGMRTGQSFRNNRLSFQKYGLVSHLLSASKNPDTTCSILGKTLSMPILIAPVSGYVHNGKIEGNPEEKEYEYLFSMTEGAAKAGTLVFTGDSGHAYMYEAGIAASKKYPKHVIPTIKPRKNQKIIEKARLAEQSDAFAVANDVDAVTSANMRFFGQPLEVERLKNLKYIISSIHLPFIVKGIMSPDEALLCLEAGAKGIVISNHGGRILDGMASPLSVLPEISAVVKNRLTIFIDGGIRHGEDVLKALALGADAVLIGRPAAIANIGGYAEGVTLLLDTLKQELQDAMTITGVPDLQHISSNILQKIK